jgi:hypothetical protein
MSAFLALFMTFLELALIGYAFATQTQGLFSDMVIYGSPFYLLMNIFNAGSPFTDGPKIYLAFFLFHVIKYIMLLRARLVDEAPAKTMLAIIFEGIYLCISGYYLN